MADDRTDPQYKVRMPEGLHARLKAAAEDSKRSMNAEIVARLEFSFQIDELNKKTRETEEEAELKVSYAVARAEMESTRDLMRTMSDRLSRIEAAMLARGLRPND